MKKDKYQEQLEQQQKLDIQTIMESKNGRSLLWRIIEQAGIYRTFEGEEKDIIRSAGKRDLGLFILAIITEVSEDQVLLMMKEARARANEEKEYYDNRSDDESEHESADPIGDYYSASGTTDAASGTADTTLSSFF